MRKFVPTMVTLGAGATFGVAFMLSCGDNHSLADAGCDCPASEPPLAGRFVTASGGPATVPPNLDVPADAVCPAGSQLITGSCTTAMDNDPKVLNLVLLSSGFFDNPPAIPTGWRCLFKNNGAMPIDVKATAICLKPGT